VLLVIGVGAPIIVYLVLVIALPRRPTDYSSYVDVDPVQAPPRPWTDRPIPPEGVPMYDIPPPPRPDAPIGAPGAAYAAAYCTATDATTDRDTQRPQGYLGVIYLGVFLVLVGAGNLLGRFDPTIRWWSFWPVLVLVIGLVHMCTRSRRKASWEPIRLFDGLIVVTVGIILLGCTMGFTTWGIWDSIFDLWPLFLVVVGISVVALGCRSSVARCIAAFLCTVTLIIGGMAFALGYGDYPYGPRDSGEMDGISSAQPIGTLGDQGSCYIDDDGLEVLV